MSEISLEQIGVLRGLFALDPGLHLSIVLALVSTVAFIFWLQPKRQYLAPHIPVVGLNEKNDIGQARERFRHDSKRMLLEGYAKVQDIHSNELNDNLTELQHKDEPFYVPTKRGERLMIPPKYVEELKNAPATTADFPATFVEVRFVAPEPR